MEHSQAPLEITTEKIEYPGFAQFVIALGLGACNTPQVREKSESPQSLAKPQFFAPSPLARTLEHGPLTTCLTTTENHPGLAKFGIALGLGPRDRGFKSRNPDHRKSLEKPMFFWLFCFSEMWRFCKRYTKKVHFFRNAAVFPFCSPVRSACPLPLMCALAAAKKAT